jgi:hypothetical protein
MTRVQRNTSTITTASEQCQTPNAANFDPAKTAPKQASWSIRGVRFTARLGFTDTGFLLFVSGYGLASRTLRRIVRPIARPDSTAASEMANRRLAKIVKRTARSPPKLSSDGPPRSLRPRTEYGRNISPAWRFHEFPMKRSGETVRWEGISTNWY